MTKSQLQQSDCRLNCARRSVDLDSPRPITSVRVDLNAFPQRLSGATCDSAGQSAAAAGVCVSDTLGTAGGKRRGRGREARTLDSQLSRRIENDGPWLKEGGEEFPTSEMGSILRSRLSSCVKESSSTVRYYRTVSRAFPDGTCRHPSTGRRLRRSHLCHPR